MSIAILVGGRLNAECGDQQPYDMTLSKNLRKDLKMQQQKEKDDSAIGVTSSLSKGVLSHFSHIRRIIPLHVPNC